MLSGHPVINVPNKPCRQPLSWSVLPPPGGPWELCLVGSDEIAMQRNYSDDLFEWA